jgi:hypothetical protein
MSKVIFAEIESTVHVLSGDTVVLPDGQKYEPHESKVLLPGETITLEEVPSYLKDSVVKGEAPGLSLLTEAQVKRKTRERAIALGELNPLTDSEEPETISVESTE